MIGLEYMLREDFSVASVQIKGQVVEWFVEGSVRKIKGTIYFLYNVIYEYIMKYVLPLGSTP